MSDMIEIKEIPKNIDLEQQILSMIIKNDKIIRDIADNGVNSMFFFNPFHQEIFKAMLYLHYNSISISYESIIDRLKVNDKVNFELASSYLIDLGGCHITEGSFDSKVELLVDYHRKRELYNYFKKRLEKDMKGIASGNIVKEVETLIDGMGIQSNIEVERFEEYVDVWLEELQSDEKLKSHKLGFKVLDDLVLVEDTNFILIGARPSVGKSALATNYVKNFCLQGKTPLFISCEMNKKEFMNRLVANMAHVEARKIKRKEHMTAVEWGRIRQAHRDIKKFNFNFYDKGGITVEQLVGLARYHKKHNNLDVLVIDYLQLLTSHSFQNQKQNQVSHISQKLKQLAMELEIPVIALSQLSRGSIENGKPREPQLSDLRDSGSLEQDANIVMMLHTDDIEQKFDSGRFIKLFVRKNRDGKLGTVNYEYRGDFVEFAEKEWINDRWSYVEQNDLTKVEEGVIDDLPF